MTLTIDLPADRQEILNSEAARRGVSPEQLATDLFDEWLEDLADVENARRVLGEGDLSDCYTLDDLRKAVGKGVLK